MDARKYPRLILARNKALSAMRKASQVIGPAAKVVAAATQTIVTIQKPTTMGVINAVSSGVNALHEVLDGTGDPPTHNYSTFLKPGVIAVTMKEHFGASLVMHGDNIAFSWEDVCTPH